MGSKKFTIHDKIVDRKTRQAISALRAEAWDKDLICNDLAGSALTNAQGSFRMDFTSVYFQELFLNRKPYLFFKIFFKNKEIYSTADKVIWNYDNADEEIKIEFDFLPVPLKKEEKKFTVSGAVRTTENIAVPGLVVEAFDQKIGRTTLLGKGKTDEAGRYHIDYTKEAAKILKNGIADLFVQVKKGRRILAKSELLINSPQHAAINLVVPKDIRRAPSDFKKIAKKMKDITGGMAPDKLNDDEMEHMLPNGNRIAEKSGASSMLKNLSNWQSRIKQNRKFHVPVFMD